MTGGRLILAADHRARGVVTIEPYAEYLAALGAALPSCDGILATIKPLADLVDAGLVTPDHETYLSLNRTGLAGSTFELDDRLVASVARAAEDGWTGIKHMTRIDRDDPLTAPALELLGQVLEESRAAGIDALIEILPWREGRIDDRVDAIVLAAVIAHDIGAPVLKVPLPRAVPGPSRIEAVSRIVNCVGVPVLFLGGPRRDTRDETLREVADAMAGGAAGMAVGRLVFQDPDPAEMARQVATIVHS